LTQTPLAFDTPGFDHTSPLDRIGFDIGFDHARHALVPPAELMLDGTAVCQGWRAGRALFGLRTPAGPRGLRQWLALRLQAWREGVEFEMQQVTPHHLLQIETPVCPVTRVLLGGALQGDAAPVVTRLREDAGYAAGNLVLLSRAAARAKAGRTAAQVMAHTERLARDGVAEDGLQDGMDLAAWRRLATLMSLAVQAPAAVSARIPLFVLPPNRVRVLNASQGLQALFTLRLQAAGWSHRARAIADLLPRSELRHDFNLFVGALAARLMAIPCDATPRMLRWAQEDAWTDGRVQRRWSQFAVQLGIDEAEALLQRLAHAGLGGLRMLVHEPAAATDGWCLPTQGRLPRVSRQAPGCRVSPVATANTPPQNRSATMSPRAS